MGNFLFIWSLTDRQNDLAAELHKGALKCSSSTSVSRRIHSWISLMCVLVHLHSALPYFWLFTIEVTKINCYETIRMSRVLIFDNENKLYNKRGRVSFKNMTNLKVYLVIRFIFLLSLWAYLCGLWTDFNQTHCSSSPTMSHNWIAHLNAVAPQWPLRRRKTLDKSRSDIALLIFASIQALPEPAGIVGFILLCHNKNNRPMKHPPEGVGGGFWNNFQLCPSFLRHCSIVLCWWDFIGFCHVVETHEIMCLEWLIPATMDSKWGLLYCAAPVA